MNKSIRTPVIIGFAGKKGSGKNFAASVINQLAVDEGFTVEEMAFADPLKAMLKHGLGLTDEQLNNQDLKNVIDMRYHQTPRQMMQSLGTDWGRYLVSHDIWLVRMRQRIAESNADVILVTDVRFDNEADLIRSLGGHIAEIIKPIRIDTDTDNHESEKGITLLSNDYMIPNSMDDKFNQNVAAVFNQILLLNAIQNGETREVTINDRVPM